MRRLIIFLILGVLLVGLVAGALALSSFDTRVTVLDRTEICDKIVKDSGGKKLPEECRLQNKTLDISDSVLSIQKNKEGIIQVSYPK